MLPDIQGARQIIGRGVSVWICYHISQGELEAAREGILVGLAVSWHYARTSFVVVQLVCAAIDSMMLDRVEELLARPESPNLYWALTALPRPFVDLGPSAELEERFLELSVEGLDDLDELESDREWNQKIDALFELFRYARQFSAEDFQRQRGRLSALARDERPGMIEEGAQRVAKMSEGEVTLR